MAGVTGRHGLNTSPNSSEELDSNEATPATKVSNPSPNDVRETLKPSNAGIVRSKVPPAFILAQSPQRFGHTDNQPNGSGCITQDPFVSVTSLSATTQSSNEASKLSPIASTFTPHSVLTSSSGSSFAFSESSAGVTLSAQLSEGFQSKLGGLASPSGLPLSMEMFSTAAHRLNDKLEGVSASFSAENVHYDLLAEPPMEKIARRGSFSTDKGASRCLMVGQVATDCPVAAIEGFFSRNAFGSVKKVVFTDLVMASTIYVQFGDMRDVVKAANTIDNSPWSWTVQYVDPQVFAVKAQSRISKSSQVSKYEAQVLVTVKPSATEQIVKVEKQLSDLVCEALSRSGDVMALDEVRSVDSKSAVYRAEFYSVDAVDRLLINSTWLEIDRFILNTKRYEPDLEETFRRSPKRVGPLIIGEEEIGIDSALQKMSMASSRTTPQQEIIRSASFPSLLKLDPVNRSLTLRKDLGRQHIPSPLDNSFNSYDRGSNRTSPFWSPTYGNSSNFDVHSSIWSSSSPGAIGQERGAMLSPSISSFYQQPLGNGAYDLQQQRSLYKGGRRQNEHNIGTHNVVDVNRIRTGLDVRSTIMLRNIPNKMTSAVLKGILDETSFGKYDFTYLRIDFANNCNVGYAFINFEDPIHIVNFVNARAGRRWNCYNSDKVAEISYATIQGRDCLIQKFRNSSVMLEQPSSRPKIWCTSGSSKGQEEPFPGPDNPSKMRRSVENAEHVGLFAPRAGQNFRDEQRRRRSQYDRGTRLAEIEDSYETTTYQYRGGATAIDAQDPLSASYRQQLGQMYYSRGAGIF